MLKKPLPYFIGLCLLTLGLLIYSCSKRFEDPSNLDLSNGTVEVPDDLLNAAEGWHRQHTGVSASNIMVLSNGKKSYVLQPKWDNAKLQHKLNGKSSIVVPSPEYALAATSKYGVVRKFIFEAENDKITEGKIIELYADSAYITSHKRDLVEKYNEKNMAGFTGAAITYDVNYKYIKSEVYKNGVLQDKAKAEILKGTDRSRDGGKTTLGTPIKTLDVTCYDVYLLTWYTGYENGSYSVGYDEQFLYRYCYGDNNEYGGGGGGGGTTPGGGGGGGGTGCNSVGKDGKIVNCDVPPPLYPPPPPVVSDVTEDITNPCLQSTYDLIMNSSNINNKINNLIQSIFGVNDKVNLTYGESTSLSNTEMGSTAPVIPGTDTFGNKVINVNIQLNANVLPLASQELAAVTILHEALHGYYQYNQTYSGNSLAQHVDMAQKYLDDLRTSVKSVFPNLPDKDANIMILGEMANIYNATPAGFASLLSNNNITTTEYNTIFPAYKNANGTTGNKGTRCP